MGSNLSDRIRGPKAAASALIIAALLVIPHFISTYYKVVIISAAFLGIFAATYDFFSGLTGYFSFAHMVLVGMGGYSSTILAQELGVPLLPAILFATLLTVLVGLVLIGIPSLRLSGLYFVIVTVIISSIAVELNIYFSDFTGGQNGYLLVPSLLSQYSQFVPAGVEPTLVKYYIAVLMLIAICGILVMLSKSHLGIILGSMKQDETLLKSMGFNPVKYRLTGFAITSLLTGFSASVWTHIVTSLNPQSHLAFARMIDIIIAMVLGGSGTIIGPVIGVFALAFFDEFLMYFNSTFGPIEILGSNLIVFRRLITMLLVLGFIYYVPNGVYPRIRSVIQRTWSEGPTEVLKSTFKGYQAKLLRSSEQSE
jgi:branched-chain amino acid transport system permease protein